jgi:hypothetical protein
LSDWEVLYHGYSTRTSADAKPSSIRKQQMLVFILSLFHQALAIVQNLKQIQHYEKISVSTLEAENTQTGLANPNATAGPWGVASSEWVVASYLCIKPYILMVVMPSN